MPKKQWFPPYAARQTLLPFQARPANEHLSKTQLGALARNDQNLPPGPPPSLPNEVWNAILSPLGTIALKKFRLICREWNVIGSDWLFQTFYLNSYEKSWSGLIALSGSPYASKVTCVEWNPLIFYNDCGDAAVWASRYQNMVCDLSHRDILRFYQAYHLVHRARQTLLRTTPLDLAAEALRHLVNCHRLVISDDHDLAYTCDSGLRAAIADQPWILQHAGTWGLRHPCVSEYGNERLMSIDHSGAEILEVVSQCPNVLQASLVVWEGALESLFSWILPGTRLCHDGISLPHLTSIECSLKVPDRPLKLDDDYRHGMTRYTTFCLMTKFTSVECLSYQLDLVNPIRFCGDRLQDTKTDCSACSTTSQDQEEDEEEDLSFVEYRPDGWTEEVARAMHSHQPLEFTLFASLRTLTLSNLSVSARSLLCFLCCQDRLPAFPFSLQLQGTVVLFSVIPKVFFESLTQLDVRISYQASSTFYYSPGPWTEQFEWKEHDLPVLVCHYNYSKPRQLFTAGHMSRVSPEFLEPPQQMPPCPSIASQYSSTGTFEIACRPNEYRYSTIQPTDIPREELEHLQFYRLRKIDNKHTIWEWVSDRVILDPRTNQPWENTFLLQALRAQPDNYYDSYGADDWVWEQQQLRDAETFDLEADMQLARMQMNDHSHQELLHQYETELLATDIQDQVVVPLEEMAAVFGDDDDIAMRTADVWRRLSSTYEEKNINEVINPAEEGNSSDSLGHKPQISHEEKA